MPANDLKSCLSEETVYFLRGRVSRGGDPPWLTVLLVLALPKGWHFQSTCGVKACQPGWVSRVGWKYEGQAETRRGLAEQWGGEVGREA